MAKFKIVVSDLHLGAGFATAGNLLEDFTSDAELVSFLDDIVAESIRSSANVELIVDGDAFEMLQVPHTAQFDPTFHYRPEQYHSSSEPDSVLKMGHIVAGHRAVFEALSRFVDKGPPRRSLTFVKGNHDLNLFWHGVQDRILQALNAGGPKAALVTFEERCISREGLYVEHGNQYAELLSRVESMEYPDDLDEPDQLALPVGSWLVMDFVNEAEREKYWVDGVKPITALLWYALRYDFPFAARALAALLRAIPDVFKGMITSRDVRADLTRQLADAERADEIASRYTSDDSFRTWFEAEVARAVPALPPGSEPEPTARGSVLSAEARGDQVRARVHLSLLEAARARAEEEGARLVVFGHTHLAGVEPLPGGATYVNCGTWTWIGDFSEAGSVTWRDLFSHPERFTGNRLLSYVRVDYDQAGQPAGRLLAYEPGKGLHPPRRLPFQRFRGWWLAWRRRTGQPRIA